MNGQEALDLGQLVVGVRCPVEVRMALSDDDVLPVVQLRVSFRRSSVQRRRQEAAVAWALKVHAWKTN